MAADPKTSSIASLSDDPVVNEARDRYNRVSEWEADWRARFLEDIKFANGDSDNGYQWPRAIWQKRDVDDHAYVTMNVIRQHNLQIINQGRQAKTQIKVQPLGNGATSESASVVRQLIRHVEYQSFAQSIAYPMAREFQVDAGLGWWRLITDYAGPDTFDQEIFIREVWDPLSVFMDPDCWLNPLTARWAFVFDTAIPRDQFDDAYPEFKDQVTGAPLGATTTGDDWIEQDHVILCEYFRKVPRADTLISFFYQGERVTVKKSVLPKSVADEVLADPLTKTRPITEDEIEWYLIGGEQILDKTIWPGKYIPLIPVVGRQTVINGRMDRQGHTRFMKSAQHMFNWNAAKQIEFGALQGKSPWIAPAKAIEEFENYWNTANTTNHSVLPYNDVDPENPDRSIAPPQRAEPPNFAPLYEKGMETAFNQMMMVSGQWQNQMGMLGNERTGRAISERQEQSDTSTYHFQDNYNNALIITGTQLIDLFPKIYDTRRMLLIQADDGTDLQLELDPSLQVAYMQQMNHEQKVVRRLFNPNLGQYQIAPDVGPAIASKRQQTVDALTLILTQAPGLTGIIGDLLLRAMDFDEAQEAAQRLRRMVPPEAMGTGPSQREQAMQQVIQQLQANLAKSLDTHGKDRVKLVGKDQMRDIDAYNAETTRMKALIDMMPMDADGLRQVIEQLIHESLGTKLLPIIEANVHGVNAQNGNEGEQQEEPPMPGAQKAPDGYWYITDPTRRSRYLRIAPLAQERKLPGEATTGS